jgi:DNA polymerase I
MSNRRYIFDIETNGLLVEATKIWCGVLIDVDTHQIHVFGENDMDAFRSTLLRANELIGHNIIMFDIPVCNRLLNIEITSKVEDTLVVSRMMYPDRFDPLNPMRAGHSLENWGKYLHEEKTDFRNVLLQKALPTLANLKNFLPKDEFKLAKKKFEDYFKKNSIAAFKEPPPFDSVSREEWLRIMTEYCVQDVKTNLQVWIKQLLWIQNNKRPLQLEYLATKLGARQVTNGWGYKRGGGIVLEEELNETLHTITEELQIIFPDIVTQRFSTRQRDSFGNPKELKPDIELFNPGSSQHIYKRFNKKYPFFNPPITEDGSPSCSSENLLPYKDRISEVGLILDYRNAEKLLGQVSDYNIKSKSTNRIHGNINLQGTVTGRCTHSNPNIGQVAKNTELRSLFVPCVDTDDYVVLGSDLEGLELRMLAHYMYPWDNGEYASVILSGDKTKGTDIHSVNQRAAGLSSRDQAKTFIYGLVYGAGDRKLGTIVNGGLAEGRMLRDKFYTSLPALQRLVDDVKHEASTYKRVTLPDTRTVPIRSEHSALNTLLQGSGAIVSKYWMIIANKNLDAAFGKNVVKQMAYVHDELQFACPKDIAKGAGKIIIDSAKEAGERLSIAMPIEADYAIGKSWAETH